MLLRYWISIRIVNELLIKMLYLCSLKVTKSSESGVQSVDYPFKLTIDPNIALDVNIQVKEQLKWLIGIGHLSSGVLLPSTSELASQLGLNRNTINLVYNHLKEEGIVSMHKGRGTHVLDNAQTEKLRQHRTLMYELLRHTVTDVQSKSIDAAEFFTASLAYGLLHFSEKHTRRRILFIECKGHDYPFYMSEISRVTGAEVQTVFLEDIASSSTALADALHYSSLVVTTLNHDDQVRMILSGRDARLLVIGATVETPALLEIASLESGSPVSFVCLGKSGGQWMAKRVQEAGINSIQFHAVGTDDHSQLLEYVKLSDRIYASAAVFNQIKEIAPDKARRFPMLLERSSEALLKDCLHQ